MDARSCSNMLRDLELLRKEVLECRTRKHANCNALSSNLTNVRNDYNFRCNAHAGAVRELPAAIKAEILKMAYSSKGAITYSNFFIALHNKQNESTILFRKPCIDFHNHIHARPVAAFCPRLFKMAGPRDCYPTSTGRLSRFTTHFHFRIRYYDPELGVSG